MKRNDAQIYLSSDCRMDSTLRTHLVCEPFATHAELFSNTYFDRKWSFAYAIHSVINSNTCCQLLLQQELPTPNSPSIIDNLTFCMLVHTENYHRSSSNSELPRVLTSCVHCCISQQRYCVLRMNCMIVCPESTLGLRYTQASSIGSEARVDPFEAIECPPIECMIL